jgi:hypothetical protein
MNKTYQPFIIEKADEILEILKEDIATTDYARETLCTLLTKKFIDGNLNPDDDVSMIFDSEEELLGFINLCYNRQNLDHLKELGFIGELDDDKFFLTEKGKLCVAALIKK